jgi:hypothetical protein
MPGHRRIRNWAKFLEKHRINNVVARRHLKLHLRRAARYLNRIRHLNSGKTCMLHLKYAHGRRGRRRCN